jgi:adenosylcobyric acid synthase
MLGDSVVDKSGAEGNCGVTRGLGLFAMTTEISSEKRVANVKGHCAFAAAQVSGYEIHMGISIGMALEKPAFYLEERSEGAISKDNQILGTYLHGLFDHPEACSALLQWAGLDSAIVMDLPALRESSLNRIADIAQPLLDALSLISSPD